jgi:hypothetical protein
MLGGLAWAAVLLGSRVAAGARRRVARTHWLLRESGVWRDRNPRRSGGPAGRGLAYRLAVDPPAAKVRLRRWLTGSSTGSSRGAPGCTGCGTTRPAANGRCCQPGPGPGRERGRLLDPGRRRRIGRIGLGSVAAYGQAVLGSAMIAFGGLNWALDPPPHGAAVLRSTARWAPPVRFLACREPRRPAGGRPRREIRFRSVSFAYPGTDTACCTTARPFRPAPGDIVGRNGAGRTTLANGAPPLRPADRRDQVDGSTCANLDLRAWRSRLTAVFQDFIRLGGRCGTTWPRPVRRTIVLVGGGRPVPPIHHIGHPTGRLSGRHRPVRAVRGNGGLAGTGSVRWAPAWSCWRTDGSSTCAGRLRSSNGSGRDPDCRDPGLAPGLHRAPGGLICVLGAGQVVELTHDQSEARGTLRQLFDLQGSGFAAESAGGRRGGEL